LALLAGVAATVALERAPAAARRAALALGVVVVSVVAAFGPLDARLSVTSDDRRAETAAALRLVVDRPLTGTGPGQATLFFDGPDGQLLTARYAHNEYLQVLTELGMAGLALVAVLLVAVGRAVRAGRASARWSGLWAGAAAGLVAMAVHSAFDFLWHVPAIPLAGALLAGVALSATTTKEHP
jgi:O-antigen ligase